MLMTQINTLWGLVPELKFPKKKSVASPDLTTQHLDCMCMSHISKIAGISGAVAVAIGAYGAHVLRDKDTVDVRRKVAFETGSRYHLIHTLALLASPRARYPWLTASLFLGGITLFCGSCYHYSITGEEYSRRVTPVGGVLFIIAWLSFVL